MLPRQLLLDHVLQADHLVKDLKEAVHMERVSILELNPEAVETPTEVDLAVPGTVNVHHRVLLVVHVKVLKDQGVLVVGNSVLIFRKVSVQEVLVVGILMVKMIEAIGIVSLLGLLRDLVVREHPLQTE